MKARGDARREARGNPLDALLPLVEGRGASLGVALLEVRSAAELVEIARDPRLGRHLLGRLSDSVALVDPGQEEALAEALRAAGHTPKMAKGEGT